MAPAWPGPARLATAKRGNPNPANPAKIVETFGDIGFDPSKERIVSAVVLNCLRDWSLFYRCDFAGGPPAEPTLLATPLIGRAECGKLGLMGLPRLWLTALLEAKGWLAGEGPCRRRGGFRALLRSARSEFWRVPRLPARDAAPLAVAFEDRVGKRLGDRLDAAKTRAFNRRTLERAQGGGTAADRSAEAAEGTPATKKAPLSEAVSEWDRAHAALWSV